MAENNNNISTQWVDISDGIDETVSTYAMKVHGGWLIRTVQKMKTEMSNDRPRGPARFMNQNNEQVTSSTVFVPDPSHEWGLF